MEPVPLWRRCRVGREGRIIFDAGRKTVGPSNLSAGHGTIRLATANHCLRIGNHLRLTIRHRDKVVHLHEQPFAGDGDEIDAVWPTQARGRLQ